MIVSNEVSENALRVIGDHAEASIDRVLLACGAKRTGAVAVSVHVDPANRFAFLTIRVPIAPREAV